MFDIRIQRSLAAFVVAGALILPTTACQSGQALQPSATVGPAAGQVVLRDLEREFYGPDRPERMGIQRWCYGALAQFDAAERAAAKRHCQTLRSY